MSRYGIKHIMSLDCHPQTNGQAEISNREIKKILENTVSSNIRDWSLKLDDVLKPTELHIKLPLVCPHTELSLENLVTFLLNWSTRLCGPSRN